MTTAPAAPQQPWSPLNQTAWLAEKTGDRGVYIFGGNPEETAERKMLTKSSRGYRREKSWSVIWKQTKDKWLHEAEVEQSCQMYAL